MKGKKIFAKLIESRLEDQSYTARITITYVDHDDKGDNTLSKIEQ